MQTAEDATTHPAAAAAAMRRAAVGTIDAATGGTQSATGAMSREEHGIVTGSERVITPGNPALAAERRAVGPTAPQRGVRMSTDRPAVAMHQLPGAALSHDTMTDEAAGEMIAGAECK